MCGDHRTSTGESSSSRSQDELPDWERIELPPEHILSHLTDAHCHPTDLTHDPSVYEAVNLGGIAAMATVPEDQPRVCDLAMSRPWLSSSTNGAGPSKGAKVVACFGYHPWFTHRYTINEPAPSKSEHYNSIFFPPAAGSASKNSSKRIREKHLMETLLPYLPDPIPFRPLVEQLRFDLSESLQRGQLTMLGEVGLDGGARVRWPVAAKDLYPERVVKDNDSTLPNKGDKKEEEEEEWKRLTPFKVAMSHQVELLKLQMEVAVELGVNVSFHCVSASGPTMECLKYFRDKYGVRFTNRINVDLHSAGGWSPEFWSQAQKQLSNLYASPSIFITGRSTSAPALIRAISSERILVESDLHDVRLNTRLVWAATEWISRCKGWKLEDRETEPWELDVDDEAKEREEERWTVRTLERNWARFMGLIDAAD